MIYGVINSHKNIQVQFITRVFRRSCLVVLKQKGERSKNAKNKNKQIRKH